MMATTLEGAMARRIDPKTQALGRLLSDQITALGLSQADFARLMGKQQRTTDRWLSGDVKPELWEVLPIARALGLEPIALLDPENASPTEAFVEVTVRLPEALAPFAQEAALAGARRALQRRTARGPTDK